MFVFRGTSWVFAAVVLCALLHAYPAEATITWYIGDKPGFDAAVVGLPQCFIDFEDPGLNVGDPITDQYPCVEFSSPYGIAASDHGYGPPAIDTLCAAVGYDPVSAPYAAWTFTFPEPVWGTSLWIGDINFFPGQTELSVFDAASNLLGSGIVTRQGDWSFVGLLSDTKDILRIDFQASSGDPGDAQAFDNVTVVPEPATLCLLALGGLAAIRRKR
ncbi:MAG TPA: PEP-CTERM sorting domain-containing protein [Phycisphaerae bacterium]|nr:PEP-CTERM sorting domain-containing protein [Phycisphaerae bacterium]